MPRKTEGTTHRLRTGPIPDSHWENETRPRSEADLRRRYGPGGLDDFDAETRRLKVETDKRTLTKPRPSSRAS